MRYDSDYLFTSERLLHRNDDNWMFTFKQLSVKSTLEYEKSSFQGTF